METLHGKASAPSAGEREHVQLEPQDKTQGNTKKHLDLITFYQLEQHWSDVNMVVSVCRWILVTNILKAAHNRNFEFNT